MKHALAVSVAFLAFMPDISAAPMPLLRDETEALKRAFDFSPDHERALDARWLMPPDTAYPFPQASLQMERGVRMIAIDGEAMPTWMQAVGATMLPGSPVERQLREAGVRLFIIDVGLTADYAEERGLGTAPEAAFAQFRKRAESLLKAVPDARLMIRFWMTSVGKDFPELYPQALLQGADGNNDWGFAYPPSVGHQTRPNMLNEWRRYCAEHLHRFLHRLGQSEYADRVAGFYLAAMNSGEWWYYKGKGDPGWDYSSTRQAAFERFARAKYGDDRAAIAKAWGRQDDENLFAIPSLHERQQRPLRPNTASVDYLHVLNLPVTNAASYFAKVVKAATSGRSLVGMEIHMGGVTYPNNGTVFMNHLLETPEIDFFGGPSDYHYRRPGASPFYRVASGSLEAHGKLWLNEGDYRTPTAFDTRSGGAGEPPMEPWAMAEVLQREFARGAVFNYSTYLMDFGWNWFYDPAFLHDMAGVMRADAFLRQTGLERRAEIALVTDQESQLFGNYFSNPTMLMMKEKLDRLGAPWDLYELRDLLKGERYRDYKMIVFLNTCALSDEERESIEKMKGGGRTLLWMYNPGTVDLSQKGRDAGELVGGLTGMTMRSGTRPGRVHLLPEAFTALGVKELPGLAIGSDEEVKETRLNREVSLSDTSTGLPIGNLPSRIYCVDPEATVLGRDAAERAFFAMRRFPEWTSVYTAFCEMEPWVLRVFARQAGCHIWSEGDDVFFAAQNYVGIHAVSTGEKRILLPKNSEAFEVFEGSSMTPAAETISLSMRRGETRFFYLGDATQAQERWTAITRRQEEERRAFTTRHPAPKVQESHFAFHQPKRPEKTGRLELTGVHRFQAPAILFAGPFASSDEGVRALDGALANGARVELWSDAQIPPAMLGREADRFLHVVHPKESRSVEALEWHALTTPSTWVNDYQLGMATGQSYAVAYQLMAEQETEVRLYVATRGEARLWVDDAEVKKNEAGIFEALLQLGAQPQQIVLRVRGDDRPTGFTLKVAGADRGRGVYSIPGSGVRTVAPNVEALVPPPEKVYLHLPEKRGM